MTHPGLVAQLELAERTLLALETYITQAREIIRTLPKLVAESKRGVAAAGRGT